MNYSAQVARPQVLETSIKHKGSFSVLMSLFLGSLQATLPPSPFCSTITAPSPRCANMPDRASEVLVEGLPPFMTKSFRALADHGDVPCTTLQHRARGRKSLQDKARSQQYLDISEEKALVNFLVQQDALGRPVRIKYVPSIAFSIAS